MDFQFGQSLFKRVRILSYPVVLIASFLLLTGQAGCDRLPFFGGQKPVTLKYWGLWEPSEVMAPLINKYQKSNHKVKIEYEKQSPREYRERLISRIAAGGGPDIFRFHNSWVPMLKNHLYQIPNKIVEKTTFDKIFYPVSVSDLTATNGVWGIPLEFDGLGLYINLDLFKAAGIDKIPTTWDELRTTASQLTVRDGGKIKTAGVALGSAKNVDHFSDILALMMLQNGATLINPTDQLAQDAVDFFTLFTKAPVEARVWDETQPASTLAFAQGNLAMYFAPSWRVFEIKAANPSLNFKIVPVPQLPGAKVTWASYWVEGVSVKSKNKEAAAAFLKFLSQPDNLQLFYTEAAKTRLFGEPYSRVDLAQTLADDPFVGAYLADAATAKSGPFSSTTFDNGLNDRTIAVLAQSVDLVLKGQSAKDVLTAADRDLQTIFAEFGLVSPPAATPR